jgi:hypothetical protein
VSADDRYELAIDTQVEKFLDLKQKLAYFLITASGVITGFTAKFVVDNARVGQHFTTSRVETVCVIASAVAGLAAAGASLFNIHLEHRSYRLHLKYRYERKAWTELTAEQQKTWDDINKWAADLLRVAFVCLFVQTAFAVFFFVVFFI